MPEGRLVPVALIPCTDLSASAWIADSNQPWDKLVGFGPTGLPAYARLRFIPDPEHPGQSENAVELGPEHPSEAELLRSVHHTLARYTRTPDDCYFCLWDGWYPDLYGTGTAGAGHQGPAFSRSLLDVPKVVVPNRAFYLFRGPLSDFGDWSEAEDFPGHTPLHMPNPAFVWPADHAWCVTNDVDPHWADIGAQASAIDQLIADARLDVVHADPDEQPPYYL